MTGFKLIVLLTVFVCNIFSGCGSLANYAAFDNTGGDDNPPANLNEDPGNDYEPPSGDFWQPPDGREPRFLFIHHSTGEGFLDDGGMRGLLKDAGFDVHNATYGNEWFGDNTDPEHFPTTFTTYYDDLIGWDLPSGQYYDIVAFKSCFPASCIESNGMLQEYYGYYSSVKNAVRQHPETLFIPFSTPPLVPEYIEPAEAARARTFADWLEGDYSDGEYNIRSYNLFDVLAGDEAGSGDFNCLRYDYQVDPYDSHPNHEANETVAEDFTNWLSDLVWGS
jgi:hypothetical protein